MKKSRKPTLVEERHFPFECSTSYGVSDDYTALHWHKELEICYIRQGTGNYLINGTEYPFSGGDIFLIGNDEIHLCHDDRDLIMQVFMFATEFPNSGYANPFDYEFLRPFYERTEHFCNKIEKDTAVSGRLTDLLSEMEKEYTTRQNAYDLMIKSLLLEFMALIVRHYFTGNNKTDPKENLSGSATEKVRDLLGRPLWGACQPRYTGGALFPQRTVPLQHLQDLHGQLSDQFSDQPADSCRQGAAHLLREKHSRYLGGVRLRFALQLQPPIQIPHRPFAPGLPPKLLNRACLLPPPGWDSPTTPPPERPRAQRRHPTACADHLLETTPRFPPWARPAGRNA